MNLPKTNRNTKTYFGNICRHHPEHGGFRLVSSKRCVACTQMVNRLRQGYQGRGFEKPIPKGSHHSSRRPTSPVYPIVERKPEDFK
jgi:hypothetical protein